MFIRGYHRGPKTFGLLAQVAQQFGSIDAVIHLMQYGGVYLT